MLGGRRGLIPWFSSASRLVARMLRSDTLMKTPWSRGARISDEFVASPCTFRHRLESFRLVKRRRRVLIVHRVVLGRARAAGG